MARPIGLQLCSVKQQMDEDFRGTIRRVADMGYAGVELSDLPEGVSYEEAGALFREHGLELISARLAKDLVLGPSKVKPVEWMKALGGDCFTFGNTGFIARGTVKRLSQLATTCGIINEAYYLAREAGMTCGVHNHRGEFEEFEGRPIYQILNEHLEPGVFWEIDTYWVHMGGRDCVEVVRELGDRVQLLHMKDGTGNQGDPLTAIGAGIMDFASIVEAAPAARWLIVEVEGEVPDKLGAVAASCEYLANQGLGAARES